MEPVNQEGLNTPVASSAESHSLERIIPEELRANEATGLQTLKLHVDRYEFARKNLCRGKVLDLACGVGYGTAILAASHEISDAIGIDISPSAVRYAMQRYANERVKFLCLSAEDFSPSEKFENVVSLETIEHVDDPCIFFRRLVSFLKPRGRLIASVPITPSVDANPHHKSNFSTSKFKELGKQNSLEYVDSLLQIQRFNPFAVLPRREQRTADLRTNLAKFYVQHPSHLALRLWSILRDGFSNKYLTIIWQRYEE